MINCILIVFHLYCCSKHKLTTILVRSVTLTFWFVYFISLYIIYDWFNTMGYSKQERSTINTLHSLKRICHMTPLPPQSGHLSTTASFFCPQGGRGREIPLYSTAKPRLLTNECGGQTSKMWSSNKTDKTGRKLVLLPRFCLRTRSPLGQWKMKVLCERPPVKIYNLPGLWRKCFMTRPLFLYLVLPKVLSYWSKREWDTQ